MNPVAKVIYNIDPSRLKLYPKGNTNPTIRLLQPNFSNAAIVCGKDASELAVEKEINKASFNSLNSRQ